MTERTDWTSIRTWRRAAVVATALLVTQLTDTASAWEFAHGDRDNSGFANVLTAPAGKGSVTVPGLGAFRPGAGPVIARDGTVYLGTAEGKLIALRPDGSRFWSRDITPGQSIVASPAIASDGSIYVIGVSTVRDNRVDPPVTTVTSTLHHFNNSGAWLNQIAFPDHGGNGPGAFGPPNIWRSGGTEAIMVPTLYRNRQGGHALRLIAFSPAGQVLDDKVVIGLAQEVLGGSGLSILVPGTTFTPPKPPANLIETPPPPGVGIFVSSAGGSSFLAVSDHYKDLVGYTFANNRFNEVFRAHQEDYVMRTPPLILPSGHTLMSQEEIKRDKLGREDPTRKGRIIATGPGATRVSEIMRSHVVQAVPTRLADGRVVLVTGQGAVIALQGVQIVAQAFAHGRSFAPAAASNNHVFVSTESTFMTYDANSLAEVARIDWVGGGLHPPAIGPQGHVYALASNILFVFPPPKQKVTTVTPVGQPTGIAEPTTPPSAQTYKPPLTAGGNRLFACEELDEDDCGKGDHREISLAWCQAKGYAKVKGFDVDKRKVKAETLDGHFCSKKTCRVFDSIGCEM